MTKTRANVDVQWDRKMVRKIFQRKVLRYGMQLPNLSSFFVTETQ